MPLLHFGDRKEEHTFLYLPKIVVWMERCGATCEDVPPARGDELFVMLSRHTMAEL